MKLCCVCKSSITADEPAVLAVGANGEEKEICEDCVSRIDILMESTQPAEVKAAIRYFNAFMSSGLSLNVETAIGRLIVAAEKKLGLTRGSAQPESNLANFNWISGMKTVTWLVFACIIIGGIAASSMLGSFWVFLGSIALAFLAVAMQMIFLNLAQDVSDLARDASEIKEMLRKRD